jgi:hypothetical protein
MALATQAHLAPRIKKEYGYTSTPLLSLYDLFYNELNYGTAWEGNALIWRRIRTVTS